MLYRLNTNIQGTTGDTENVCSTRYLYRPLMCHWTHCDPLYSVEMQTKINIVYLFPMDASV